MTPQTSARLKLILLALVFLGPLALAWALYFGSPGWTPQERTNRGQLLDPARPLPEIALQAPGGGPVGRDVFDDQWTLVYVDSGACMDACRKRLHDTRQVRAALHRRAVRVQRVYVSLDRDLPEGGIAARLDERHPNLKSYRAADDRLARFLGATVDNVGDNGFVYLLDPLGNWVLYYRPDQPAEAMLDDLKKLLKVSRIG